MDTEALAEQTTGRAHSRLEEGMALARHGDKAAARELFRELIHQNPYDEDAWLWLAWVASDPKATLACLQEARALLPESGRIGEAMTWAQSQLPASARAQTAPTTRAQRERQARALLGRVDEAGRRAQRTASRKLGNLKGRVADVELPRMGLPGWGASALSIGALVVLILLVLLAATRLRQGVPVVRAMELPEPVAEAAATPSMEQMTSGYWSKADVALMQQDWTAAQAALEQVRAVDPDNIEARQRLAEVHYNLGTKLIQGNDLDGAMVELNAAVRLDASSKELQKARQDLALYLSALDAYWAKDWNLAVSLLQQVYQSTPAFRDTRTMLGQAYANLGRELIAKDQLDSAQNAARSAVELLPESQEAQALLTDVNNVITPPRRIEVDLSDKLAVVYEEGKAVKTFRVCTGRPSAPTVPGRYKIKTRLEMAYASKWDLQMPYWLGIYDAGGSENGFHALPILSNGATLWRSALGTSCSFGCIVLDTKDAEWLYNWGELGTVVFVTK